MNLAFCLFKYFPYGGLQRNFLRIASLCRERGHRVTVFTQHWQGKIPPGLTVQVIPLRSFTNHGRCREFARLVLAHLAENKFDLVVGFNKMPGLDIYYAADLCFQQTVRETHGMLYRLTPRYRNFLALEQAVFSPAASTRILLLVEQQQAVFQHYYQTQTQRFELLPPGIAKDRIAPANAAQIRNQLRREFAIADEANVLLMIGSGFKRKGLDRILLAMSALPAAVLEHTQLLVLGADRPAPFLWLAKRLGLTGKIRLLGGRDDVPRFLLAADLLLHPARGELAGMVLLEALCAGLPVLTTAVCGYAFHIERAQAGRVLAQPYQQGKMDQTLCEMLTSGQLDAWRSNALHYAKTTDLFSRLDSFIKLIEAGK